MPKHALNNLDIYKNGRLEAQPHGELTREMVYAEFSNPDSAMVGRTAEQWYQMIVDMSGNLAVFNSFELGTNAGSEEPKGTVRSRIDSETGVRHLESLYVVGGDGGFQGSGHGQALFAAVADWHKGEEFRLRVAAYNERAIEFYEKLGCFATSQVGLGYEMQGVFVPQIEMVSPSRAHLLH